MRQKIYNEHPQNRNDYIYIYTQKINDFYIFLSCPNWKYLNDFKVKQITLKIVCLGNLLIETIESVTDRKYGQIVQYYIKY